ncbi:MAG: hypothetical protein FGM15_11800 [Chthoniobacterales bacterium]|nr:hypothetical protein [Chthoniobacterales bacterium]
MTNTESREQPVVWSTPSGRVSLLPSRGRILQIEAEGQPCFWNPPQVTASWNLGGERLWVGPEYSWFWKQTERLDFEQYQVPPGLDPDRWSVTALSANACEASLQLDLRCHHADRHLRLHILRRFELLDDEALALRGAAAGLAVTTSMQIHGGTPGQAADLWSLIQVPAGGKMLMPLAGPAKARDYFDPCPPGEIDEAGGFFSLNIGGSAVFKIGVGPDRIAGRIAYVRAVGGRWLVLERSFPVHAALPYCDAPLDAQGTQGDAAQFFNDGGKFGVFGEMEHRSPAIHCGRGPQSLGETTITTAALLDPGELDAWKEQFLGHS